MSARPSRRMAPQAAEAGQEGPPLLLPPGRPDDPAEGGPARRGDGWSEAADGVLAVIGAKSQERERLWQERQDLLLAWLPLVEPLVLPGATHLLQVENPHDIAEGLAASSARHPLSG